MGLPRLCRHKASGLAYVTDPATRKEVYLRTPDGKPARYGTPEAEAAYRAWLAGYLARTPAGQSAPLQPGLTVAELLAAYLEFAATYYVKHGKPTAELVSLRTVAGVLEELHAGTPAAAFTPGALKAVRDVLVSRGYHRATINAHLGRVRRIWRWGVGEEAVPSATLEALAAVAPLTKGRTTAPESELVKAVPWETIAAILPQLKPRRRVLVEFHYLAGCRAGEAVILRPCDLDTSGEEWLYVPHTHKTEHHEGRAGEKEIWLGQRAQALLRPLLDEPGPADRWLFPSVGRGKAVGRRSHLSEEGYASMLETACQRAGAEAFSPGQIRHSRLTDVRRRYGLEEAQAVGGHAEISTTQIYAERDRTLARKVAHEMG